MEQDRGVVDSQAGQSVLLMAHGFVPAAMIGTMRTLRLVRRMTAEGWRPTVLMSSPGTYLPSTPQDPALMSRLPMGVQLVHAPTLRPIERLARWFKRTAARSPFDKPAAPVTCRTGRRSAIRRIHDVLDEVTTIPDREVGWLVPAVYRALVLIRRERPLALYSTAPPWSAQVAALVVARLSGIPWVADFRDPWARAPWREAQPDRQRRAGAYLEAAVIKRADAVLFATPANHDEYVCHYGPEVAAKFVIVPNGCDPDEFAGVPRKPADDVFTLLHAGSLYGQRSPVPLLRALAAAMAKGTLRRDAFRLRLIGASALESDTAAAVHALGLEGVVESIPRLPRRAILEAMGSATALLALQPGTTVSIPGKLYEYLAIGKPILALCEEGDSADLVRSSGIGVAVTSNETSAIEAGIERILELVKLPLDPPHPDLYDGRRSARATMEVIAAVGTRGRRQSHRGLAQSSRSTVGGPGDLC